MFIIFDYDGVIIDSTPAIHEALTQLHAQLNLHVPSVEEAKLWIGPLIPASVSRIRQTFELPEDLQKEMEITFFNAYVAAATSLTNPYPGMLDLLTELKDTPKALATMKTRSEFNAITTPLPGLDHFDIVVAPPDQYSGYTKKMLVGEALDALVENFSDLSDGVMIGDRASDIEAGKSYSLRTIAVSWGAGTIEELESAEPDLLVNDVASLRRELF